MTEQELIEIREVMRKECDTIHEFLLQNPLQKRSQAIGNLIKMGEIRPLNTKTHLIRYKETYGKCDRKYLIMFELNEIKKYIETNALEVSNPTILSVVKTLKNLGKIREHINNTHIVSEYNQTFRKQEIQRKGVYKKGKMPVERPLPIPQNMSTEMAKYLVSDYEKYNFEGRIMSLEVKLAYKILSNSINV